MQLRLEFWGKPQGLGGTQSASFCYDPMGRRSAKTISTTTTGYSYDGMDFVQELNGTTSASGVRANLITSGLDEPLLSITGTGSTATLSHFFSDANNNVIALTDSTQAIATKYSYGAYGQSKQTTVSGSTNTNSQQYTGRENDQTGLLYYRARYYHVGCARFISEDPIGWASGQTNNYAYVGRDPINFVDPTGKFAFVLPALPAVSGWIAAGIGACIGAWLGWEVLGPMLQEKTPHTGEPGSCHVNPGSGQERQYGADGKPEYDIDWDHDHGQGTPHGNNWDNVKRSPGAPVSPWPIGRGPGQSPITGTPITNSPNNRCGS